MSVNAYKPHLLVLPEDDANRQIANGFLLDPNLNSRAIQVLPIAGGWGKVLEKFNTEHAVEMQKYSDRRMVLLLDFDDKENERLILVQNKIPDNLKDRVFVLGVKSEPERLKTDCNKSFEKIGEIIAQECAEHKTDFWLHPLLIHNQSELIRLINNVKPFLFN